MTNLSDYPKSLTSNRDQIESGFIFSLWNNPDTIGEYERDIDIKRDFKTSSGIFYYGIALGMYKKGYRSFDEASIYTYLSDKESVQKIFENKGGMDSVNELTEVFENANKNLESYYDELIKNNAILQLHDEGYDVSTYYDMTKHMTYAELEDFMEFKLNNIFLKSASSGINIADLTTNYDSWIDKWDSGDGVGFRVGFNLLNYHLAGIHRKNLILHLGGIGGGKAQSLDSKILTPNGYVRMGDMKIGDELFGEDGKVHNVTGVFPQGEKDMYEVVFSDGSKTITCDEHLWDVQNPTLRKENKYKTKTLKEIMNDGLYKEYKGNNHKTWMQYIPMTKPLDFNREIELPIDPYILGVLIGDGCLNNCSVTVSVNKNDSVIIDKLNTYCLNNELELRVAQNKENCTDYRLTKLGGNYNNLIGSLKGMDLFPSYSDTKFIPKEYLQASIKDRIELLSGLIDTDGEVNNANYNYSSVSERLVDDVTFLVQSLGGTSKKEIRQTYYTHKNEKKKGKLSYRLHIKMPVNIQAFKTDKHKSKFKQGQTDARRTMREVNYIGKMEAQCISTSNPTQLYLTDDMIVTHNTTSALLYYILPVLESGEKVAILANEQDEEQFRQMILASVLFNRINYRKMNRQKLLFGGFTEDDKAHLKLAAKWLEQYKDQLYYAHMTDYGTSNIKRLVKKYSKLGVGIFLVDTLKPQDESSDKAWAEFSETAKMLFQMAQKEDIAIVATAQLSSESAKRRFLDLSCIGKSRAIAETAGQVVMFRALKDIEKEKLFVYTHIKDEFGKYTNSKKQILLDKDKDYIVVFIPKNRYGSTDVQIVYERNMSFNYLKELGYTHIEYDGFGK